MRMSSAASICGVGAAVRDVPGSGPDDICLDVPGVGSSEDAFGIRVSGWVMI